MKRSYWLSKVCSKIGLHGRDIRVEVGVASVVDKLREERLVVWTCEKEMCGCPNEEV